MLDSGTPFEANNPAGAHGMSSPPQVSRSAAARTRLARPETCLLDASDKPKGGIKPFFKNGANQITSQFRYGCEASLNQPGLLGKIDIIHARNYAQALSKIIRFPASASEPPKALATF